MPTKAEIISWAAPIGIPGGYPGWRVRFRFLADCGRNHEMSLEHVWKDEETYYGETRDIWCSEVEGRCSDPEVTTTVWLIHPHRTSNDSRRGELQRYKTTPDWNGPNDARLGDAPGAQSFIPIPLFGVK